MTEFAEGDLSFWLRLDDLSMIESRLNVSPVDGTDTLHKLIGSEAHTIGATGETVDWQAKITLTYCTDAGK